MARLLLRHPFDKVAVLALDGRALLVVLIGPSEVPLAVRNWTRDAFVVAVVTQSITSFAAHAA